MIEGNLNRTVSIVLRSTLSSDSWDLDVPLDVSVSALITKLLSTPELGFRVRDDLGFLVTYALFWEEGSRFLRESETLRSAGVNDRNAIVLMLEQSDSERKSLELSWATVRIGLLLPRTPMITFPMLIDMPARAIVDNLLADSKLDIPIRDPHGEKLVYRLKWNEKRRLLEDSETLREAGVALGDAITLLTVRRGAGPPKSVKKTSVFISYARHDQAWLVMLKVHLQPLEREDLIDVWDDTRLDPGAKWREEISTALDRAQVAVLLVSAHFLASDFIATDELPKLLAKAKSAGTKILPVVVTPTLWEARTNPLTVYQSVNEPEKPLSGMAPNEQDEFLVKVARSILASTR